MRLLGKDTRRQLLGRHFEAEEAHNRAIERLGGAVVLRLRPVHLRDVEGDVGRQRRLAHRRAARENDKVGILQPAHHAVEVRQARRKPGQAAIALIRLGRHLDRLGRRVAKRHEARAVLALVGKVEQPLLGLLDLRLRRRLHRRIVGRRSPCPRR